MFEERVVVVVAESDLREHLAGGLEGGDVSSAGIGEIARSREELDESSCRTDPEARSGTRLSRWPQRCRRMRTNFEDSANMSTAFTIVGLGESLFDVFPDRAILGGAPLNVAYHAHQLCSGSGGRGLVASRVGADELGRRLLEELRMRRLSEDFVQIDDAHPTGRVDITLHHGEPTYDFLANVAWDHLEWTPEWRRLAESTDAVVFGTLAQRCPTSRATVQRFVETARQAIRLFDVNLRVAFFDAESLRRGAELATAIKLNADELPIVLRLLGLAEDVSGSVMREEYSGGAGRLLQAFTPTGLRDVVVTRGEQGTDLLTHEGLVRGAVARFEPHPQADNVGAGDACSAGLLWGWLNGWPAERTVTFANRLGAFVASQPGATPAIPDDLRP